MSKRGSKNTSLKKALERNRKTSASKAAEGIPVTDFQSHIREIVCSRFADIIAAMAQKSAEGSLSHAKYLFEISGVKEELQLQSEDSNEPTLAELLLAEVRRHQSAQAQTSSAAGLAVQDKGDASSESDAATPSDTGQSVMICGAKAQ